MHDLNTINRLNEQAHGKAIERWRSEGKYVVASKQGLTLIGAAPFDTAEQAARVKANLEASPLNRNTGFTVEVLAPTAPHYSVTRDQSEDRRQPWTLEELAALGRTGEEKTLGEYIARKAY